MGAIVATVMLASRAGAPLGQIAMTLARFRQATLSLRILDQVMSQNEPKHGLEPALQAQFRRQTEALCAMYPIGDYGER